MKEGLPLYARGGVSSDGADVADALHDHARAFRTERSETTSATLASPPQAGNSLTLCRLLLCLP